jgi:hypothetical protein
MPKLPHDQQKAVLEGHVGKIDKVLQNVVRDGKRMTDILDQDATAKLSAYLHARVNDMIADLGKAKRSVFSLDAPVEYVGTGYVPTPTVAISIPSHLIVDGPVTATPSVPQPKTEEDDELAAIAELDEQPAASPAPKATAMFDMAPTEPDPTRPPGGKWKKPTGRLVGTKEPVWVRTDAPVKEDEAPTEKPDHTGYIKEAGFLEAE